jgi:hypothetical protein
MKEEDIYEIAKLFCMSEDEPCMSCLHMAKEFVETVELAGYTISKKENDGTVH